MSNQKEKVCRACNHKFIPSFSFDFYQTGSDPEVGVCERCMLRGITVSENPVAVPYGHAESVCKVGKEVETCSFLCLGAGGHKCAKGTPLEPEIRRKLERGEMRSKGDNCSGAPDFKVA
ncbi:MAG TPA: hypothetical protein VJ579_03135 [Candidatus Paceibacterota bacterium]|nr:hypothetical protein [Candidatus Paceibacterota bacterium]